MNVPDFVLSQEFTRAVRKALGFPPEPLLIRVESAYGVVPAYPTCAHGKPTNHCPVCWQEKAP